MRHSDPNDFPQIGGQGIGIRTLQTFLREDEQEISRVYDDICRASNTAHLFPIRGKAFYLGIAKMHASYVMVSGKAQEARHKRIRSVFGISDAPSRDSMKSLENIEEHTLKCEEAVVHRIPQVQSQLSAATQRSSKHTRKGVYIEGIGTSHHSTEVQKLNKKPSADPVRICDASTSLQNSSTQKSKSSAAGSINISDYRNDLKSSIRAGPKFESHENRTSFYESGMQKAARSMNASIDIALTSKRPAPQAVNARQPVIRGRVRTLDDHVKIWLRGVYRGVLIRKLRSVDYRKKAIPPITNAEWTTEKHAVRRLFEAVNIVAHYLPGQEPSESVPKELWEIALNEAYRELAEGKGRKTSMTLIKSNAKQKGIDFKCRNPRKS